MRAFLRALRIQSAVTLFFFCWTYLPVYAAVAWAAEKPRLKNIERADRVDQVDRVDVMHGNMVPSVQRPEEKFEKALEDIREKIGKADDKLALSKVEGAGRGDAATGEIEAIKKQRIEIEKLDVDLKKEFASTEKKLKDANLPKEILDRHYKFVKHYEDNLKELKANLAGIEQGAEGKGFKDALRKAKAHLEKTKPPTRHIPLDPNKLPHRTVKAKQRAPRLKKEDFERDFPQQKTRGSKNIAERRLLPDLLAGKTQHKPILLAFNETAGDVPFSYGVSKPDYRLDRLTTSDFADGIRFAGLTIDSILLNSAISAAGDPPTADDLAETLEVQFTQDIKDLAAQLNYSPVKIYNWVRNNIIYEPYYGSFKGASQTLAESAGNDFDQASLLIALLRVSGIAAKYSYGTIEIPAEKVMNWVGGVSDPRTAATILSTQGIPVKLMVAGGTVKAIQMEKIWVEAWIDYFPSWGARHKQGGEDTWIPLDPSFKQYTYKQGMDMYALMGFNAEQFLQEYITDTRDITAYQDYGKRLVDFIDTNYPDATIEQVFGASDIKSTKTIIKQEFSYLLGTLPYKTIVKAAQFSQVPSTKDYAITIQIEGNSLEGVSSLTYSGYLHYLADKRITVSYNPATSTDEALVAQYNGNMIAVPPYLLNVKPVLKIAGTTVATGAPIGLGQDQNIMISFAGPDGDMDRIQNVITAGAYSAIILQSQATPTETPAKNMEQLIANAENISTPGMTLDDLLGQMLYSIGVSYFHKLSFENAVYTKNLQLINLRQPAEAMVSHEVEVNYLFGLPRFVAEGGINIDVDRNINVVVSPSQDNERMKAFMILSGLSSSTWENRILQAFFDVPSVSAVRLLKLASEQGIPIYTITSTNLNELLSQLQVGADVKTDIVNAINAGKKVIVSRTNVTYNQWAGAGYIIIDAVTGAAGYMISGGLAGGGLSDYLLLPPSFSLMLISSFAIDYWRTFWIRKHALNLAKYYTDTPYVYGGKTEEGFDCSGLVYYIYKEVDKSFPTGTAATQYEHCGKNGWLRFWGERLPGDIVWKSSLGHVGIEAGINTITWPPYTDKTFTGETIVHASGRPCTDGVSTCGTFKRVIETPLNENNFGVPADKVGRPR